MANILMLTHRIPFPPNKGDKIHSYRLLKHLSARHRLHLGTFVDDPADLQHLPAVRAMCADMHAVHLRPWLARLRGLPALVRGQALTLAYYRDAGLQRWVQGLEERGPLDAVVVHSSSMLQYARLLPAPLLADLNDVDSVKWGDYARARPRGLGALYRRESRLLLQEERRGALQSRAVLFATDTEAALFRGLAPESADHTDVLGNGVDIDYFSPQAQRASPYPTGEMSLVFVGTMNYWPNVDAVCWFANQVLPGLRRRWPQIRFHIVGRHPTAEVRALRSEAVNVVGTVPDTRGWLQHATAVVLPLRMVRGIINKALEAMAMTRPVLTSTACARSIQATSGQQLLVADEAAQYEEQLSRVLDPRQPGGLTPIELGLAARQFVAERYRWADRMQRLDNLLQTRCGVVS